MKLSKTLLSAILIGITVQTLPACKKDKPVPDSKTNKGTNGTENKNLPSGPCIACGMG